MNEILLRSAKVIDPKGPHHNDTVDIRITKGRVTEVGKRLKHGKANVVRSGSLHISPGWVDTRAHLCEPGEEFKEDIVTGLNAAAAGGFTAIAPLPSTLPPIDSRADIQYLLQRSSKHVVTLLPLGCITQQGVGAQLAEMHDMRTSGALGFTDDSPLDNARLMLLAMQYTRDTGGVLMTPCYDTDLCSGGQMHEGPVSARAGMRGIPPMAEQVRLMRDLALLDYTGATMHVATISTAGSVTAIREAKAQKLNVTASVAAHQLLLDDGLLGTFDPLYKVMPPLRDQEHINALIAGVKDGTIDAICSDHRPQDVEHKDLEFAQAAFGMIGLQTAYACATTAMSDRVSTLRIVEAFCHGPRKVLGLPVPHIELDGMAEITLFDPTEKWTLQKGDIRSKSKNTPLIGKELKGRPLGIVSNGQVLINTV